MINLTDGAKNMVRNHTLLLTILLKLICFDSFGSVPTKEPIYFQKSNYTFFIYADGFRFGLLDKEGNMLLPPHPSSGVSLGKGDEERLRSVKKATVVSQSSDSLVFIADMGNKERAKIVVILDDRVCAIAVEPLGVSSTDTLGYTIDVQAGGVEGPAYGLGDHGGYGESTDVFGYENDDFGNRDNHTRFVSNFCIFPSIGLGQVLFEHKTKRVSIKKSENRLGAKGVEKVKVYYFIGSPREIYKDYQSARIREGFRDQRPKFGFFELGYEAFGSLGWNTFQSSVEEDIATYLDKGYPIKWAVVGSGFWKGERRKATEGSTTSFGIWDDEASGGRNDGLPDPRYPNPDAFKDFFKARDISLLLGLRINFKGMKEFGGFYDETNDGKFVKEGVEAGYFITDKRGKPETYRVNFPKGNVFLLDGQNPAAVDWYVTGADRWGVDGFKEDLMLLDGKKLNNDTKLNAVNEALMSRNYLVMARNSAYAVAGDILRLEDTKHGFDQDRPLINALNYAASGAAAVYLDIVAGKYLENPLTEDQKIYFVRNAMTASVSPVMAMGHGPWHLQNPDYEEAVKKAAQWHVAYAAYLYSAALESYYTGFPSVMTPLPVAFPDDANTYQLASKAYRQYAWMLGESLLATPLFGNDYATATKRNVYLPEGRWMDYETKAWFEGPVTLENYDFPIDKIPVFVGGKGVLVREHENRFEASVYSASDVPFSYTFHFPDGEKKAVVHKEFFAWEKGAYRIHNMKTGEIKEVYLSNMSDPLTFEVTPGAEYKLAFNDQVK